MDCSPGRFLCVPLVLFHRPEPASESAKPIDGTALSAPRNVTTVCVACSYSYGTPQCDPHGTEGPQPVHDEAEYLAASLDPPSTVVTVAIATLTAGPTLGTTDAFCFPDADAPEHFAAKHPRDPASLTASVPTVNEKASRRRTTTTRQMHRSPALPSRSSLRARVISPQAQRQATSTTRSSVRRNIDRQAILQRPGGASSSVSRQRSRTVTMDRRPPGNTGSIRSSVSTSTRRPAVTRRPSSRATARQATEARAQMSRLRERIRVNRNQQVSPVVTSPSLSRHSSHGNHSRRHHHREVVIDNSHRHHEAKQYRCREYRPQHRIYHDRPYWRHGYGHHSYAFHDSHYRRCHRVIWPSYRCHLTYGHGLHTIVKPWYPYHHRKYVFVSLGGYWPSHCSSVRYHWYGWHPYSWYGYRPLPRATSGSNNTYTYNYYGNAPAGSTYVDHTTFADVREKMAVKDVKPTEPGESDRQFETGVKAFESGDYQAAANAFQTAMALDPEDTVLPFAYAQALFAVEEYEASVMVLREALTGMEKTEQGVFYPRGLYADDDTLFNQVDALMAQVDTAGTDADLQLLLGYHLLGIGETEAALEPLQQAAAKPDNLKTVEVLKSLAERIIEETPSTQTSD